MKCPICGCKIKENFMCPYCKITGEQVKGASNKKAKDAIRRRDTKEVYMSTTLPKDVNNTRLLLITLFGGLFGVHHMHVGKVKTGIFYLYAFLQTIVVFLLSKLYFPNSIIMGYIRDIAYLIEAIVLLVWISDFIKVCCKKFPIPVVLGEEKFKKEK